MEMNLENNEDNIRSLYVYTKAFSVLMKENTGLIINIEVDWMKESYGVDKVLLYKKNGQILIYKCESDEHKSLDEGQMVSFVDINLN